MNEINIKKTVRPDGFDSPMGLNSSLIQKLVDRPGESLSVELKRWIDPTVPEHQSKIVRAALALRNHGGGYLVIGFDNDTLQPDKNNVPKNVKSAFHIDKIQGLVSRFASEPFEVVVEFPEREGHPYPVIVIPPGVKTPVASKSDLRQNGNNSEKLLISTGDIYVRSLRSNNTPSTTKACWNDWPKIVEVCFDNREADIGRFIRRHLSGVTPEMMGEFASAITKGLKPEVTTEDHLLRLRQESEDRYKAMVCERAVKLPDHGAWEVALILIGDVPAHKTDMQFLNLLSSCNPNYTGWPIWLDSRSFGDIARPYVFEDVWEAFFKSPDSGRIDHGDFMRLDPKGRFYLRRELEEGIYGTPRTLQLRSVFNFALPVIRTAEAIAVGIAFGKAMGCTPEGTLLAFAFRWTRLKDRELVSCFQTNRVIFPGKHAYQDEVLSFVNVPLETPLSALSEFVNQVVQRLFVVFDGFSLGKDVVEDLTRRLVERKL